jgi:hypothetical protein
MSKDVFISHSSKDAEISGTICRALEDRGLNCWIAPRDIGPGENFQESIVRAIRAAKVMVLIFSANANDSAEVKKELVLASQHKLSVIPVRIEDVVPAEAFAYELSTRQWVDMFTTTANAVGRVGDQIKQMLTAGGEPSVVTPVPQTKAAERGRRSPAIWMIGAAAVAILLVLGGLFWFLQRPAVAPAPSEAVAVAPPAVTPPATPPAAAPPAAAPASPPPAAAEVTSPKPAPQAPPTQKAEIPAVTQNDIDLATRSCAEAQPFTADDPPTKVKFANALIQCSVMAQQSRELPRAGRQARVALNVAEGLAAGSSGLREFAGLLGLSHARFGHVLEAVGDLPAAAREYQADITLREGLYRQAPNLPLPKVFLSVSEVNLARVLQAQGDITGARQAYGRCLDLRSVVTANHPDNVEWKEMKTACEKALSSLNAADHPH